MVERLPGYAHDLNPIEMVWGNVKAVELANLCPDTIDEARAAAEAGLDRVERQLPAVLRLPGPHGPFSMSRGSLNYRKIFRWVSPASIIGRALRLPACRRRARNAGVCTAGYCRLAARVISSSIR